jgi:hypothetical protein
MEQTRQAILANSFIGFKKAFLANYQTTDEERRLTQKQQWFARRLDRNLK